MIFTTMAEQNRVMGMIERHEMFDDLQPDQKMSIWGAYDMMNMVESWLEGMRPIDSDPLYEKTMYSYLEEASDRLKMLMACEVANMYVSFCDDNYSEECKQEEEPEQETRE